MSLETVAAGGDVATFPPLVDPAIMSDVDALRRAVEVDDEAVADVVRYRDLIALRGREMNLVGPSVLTNFWRRHVLDCAQLLRLAPTARTWIDIGSGAGFPGIVLAILLKKRPGIHVHLVESIGKKARFLREVVASLDLPAEVHCVRAEAWTAAANAEIVTARACAPLSQLIGYASPATRGGGRALFLKGRTVEAELAQARQAWRFQWRFHRSLSDPDGRIVEIWDVARA